MNKRQARQYLLSFPEAKSDYPFGPDVEVFKVCDKMFATLSERDGIGNMNLKCAPDKAVELRTVFDAVLPGYHMNKRHWNTIVLDGDIPNGEIERMIENSYSFVVQGLPKNARQSLEIRHGQEAIYSKPAS